MAVRGGEVRGGADGHAWAVYFDGQPQYLVVPVPAKGKFTCDVTQTINGKHLEGQGTYATRDEALAGGLNDLRNALGW
jgi:hypothetical protein